MYYIYDQHLNKYIFHAKTKEKMIRWFACFNSWYSKNNTALSRIAMNRNDIIRIRSNDDDHPYIKRHLMVFDEYHRVIDPRQYTTIIQKIKPWNLGTTKTKTKKWIYRYDPIPKTGKKTKRNTYYKKQKSMIQEKRKALDENTIAYIRPSRQIRRLYQLTEFNEYIRPSSKSWKCKKKKYQWQ